MHRGRAECGKNRLKALWNRHRKLPTHVGRGKETSPDAAWRTSRTQLRPDGHPKVMYDCSGMALNIEKPARFCLILVLLAALTACGSRHHGPAVAQRGFYKVGNPYTIDGVTYVSIEDSRPTE